MDDLVTVLRKVDLRPVPCPDTFNPNSGQFLRDFLETFEQYCKYNFRGNSKLWEGQLSKFISGDVRQGYDALRVPVEDYHELWGKMVEWLDNSQDKLNPSKGFRRLNVMDTRRFACMLHNYKKPSNSLVPYQIRITEKVT